jgi:hypothetical protein
MMSSLLDKDAIRDLSAADIAGLLASIDVRSVDVDVDVDPFEG